MRKFKKNLKGKIVIRCRDYEKRVIGEFNDVLSVQERVSSSVRRYILKTEQKDKISFFPNSGKKLILYREETTEKYGDVSVVSSQERTLLFYKEERVGVVLFLEGFLLLGKKNHNLLEDENIKKIAQDYGLSIKTTRFLDYYGFDLFDHFSFRSKGDFITESEMILTVEEDSEAFWNDENNRITYQEDYLVDNEEEDMPSFEYLIYHTAKDIFVEIISLKNKNWYEVGVDTKTAIQIKTKN